MDIRALRYFIAVYEELSLSAAAKRCFVAQPSISSAIKQLESELNCPLFVRHARGVTPTQDGEKLFPLARKLIDDTQSVKNLFHEPQRQIPLRLALMPFLSGKRISLIIQALQEAEPGFDLSIVSLHKPADARIVAASQVTPSETFHKLWKDRYVLALPKGHPLALQKTVSLSQLDGIAFISRQPCEVDQAWKFATEKQGIRLNTKATVENEEYALDLVAAGLGVSIVPSQSIDNQRNVTTRPVADLNIERIVGLAYEVNHALPPTVVHAIEKVKSALSHS